MGTSHFIRACNGENLKLLASHMQLVLIYYEMGKQSLDIMEAGISVPGKSNPRNIKKKKAGW